MATGEWRFRTKQGVADAGGATLDLRYTVRGLLLRRVRGRRHADPLRRVWDGAVLAFSALTFLQFVRAVLAADDFAHSTVLFASAIVALALGYLLLGGVFGAVGSTSIPLANVQWATADPDALELELVYVPDAGDDVERTTVTAASPADFDDAREILAHRGISIRERSG